MLEQIQGFQDSRISAGISALALEDTVSTGKNGVAFIIVIHRMERVLSVPFAKMLPTKCFSCRTPFTKERQTVQLICDCLIVICQDCARKTIAYTSGTFRTYLECPKCKDRSIKAEYRQVQQITTDAANESTLAVRAIGNTAAALSLEQPGSTVAIRSLPATSGSSVLDTGAATGPPPQESPFSFFFGVQDVAHAIEVLVSESKDEYLRAHSSDSLLDETSAVGKQGVAVYPGVTGVRVGLVLLREMVEFFYQENCVLADEPSLDFLRHHNDKEVLKLAVARLQAKRTQQPDPLRLLSFRHNVFLEDHILRLHNFRINNSSNSASNPTTTTITSINSPEAGAGHADDGSNISDSIMIKKVEGYSSTCQICLSEIARGKSVLLGCDCRAAVCRDCGQGLLRGSTTYLRGVRCPWCRNFCYVHNIVKARVHELQLLQEADKMFSVESSSPRGAGPGIISTGGPRRRLGMPGQSRGSMAVTNTATTTTAATTTAAPSTGVRGMGRGSQLGALQANLLSWSRLSTLRTSIYEALSSGPVNIPKERLPEKTNLSLFREGLSVFYPQLSLETARFFLLLKQCRRAAAAAVVAEANASSTTAAAAVALVAIGTTPSAALVDSTKAGFPVNQSGRMELPLGPLKDLRLPRRAFYEEVYLQDFGPADQAQQGQEQGQLERQSELEDSKPHMMTLGELRTSTSADTSGGGGIGAVCRGAGRSRVLRSCRMKVDSKQLVPTALSKVAAKMVATTSSAWELPPSLPAPATNSHGPISSSTRLRRTTPQHSEQPVTAAAGSGYCGEGDGDDRVVEGTIQRPLSVGTLTEPAKELLLLLLSAAEKPEARQLTSIYQYKFTRRSLYSRCYRYYKSIELGSMVSHRLGGAGVGGGSGGNGGSASSGGGGVQQDSPATDERAAALTHLRSALATLRPTMEELFHCGCFVVS